MFRQLLARCIAIIGTTLCVWSAACSEAPQEAPQNQVAKAASDAEPQEAKQNQAAKAIRVALSMPHITCYHTSREPNGAQEDVDELYLLVRNSRDKKDVCFPGADNYYRAAPYSKTKKGLWPEFVRKDKDEPSKAPMIMDAQLMPGESVEVLFVAADQDTDINISDGKVHQSSRNATGTTDEAKQLIKRMLEQGPNHTIFGAATVLLKNQDGELKMEVFAASSTAVVRSREDKVGEGPETWATRYKHLRDNFPEIAPGVDAGLVKYVEFLEEPGYVYSFLIQAKSL